MTSSSMDDLREEFLRHWKTSLKIDEWNNMETSTVDRVFNELQLEPPINSSDPRYPQWRSRMERLIELYQVRQSRLREKLMEACCVGEFLEKLMLLSDNDLASSPKSSIRNTPQSAMQFFNRPPELWHSERDPRKKSSIPKDVSSFIRTGSLPRHQPRPIFNEEMLQEKTETSQCQDDSQLTSSSIDNDSIDMYLEDEIDTISSEPNNISESCPATSTEMNTALVECHAPYQIDGSSKLSGRRRVTVNVASSLPRPRLYKTLHDRLSCTEDTASPFSLACYDGFLSPQSSFVSSLSEAPELEASESAAESPFSVIEQQISEGVVESVNGCTATSEKQRQSIDDHSKSEIRRREVENLYQSARGMIQLMTHILQVAKARELNRSRFHMTEILMEVLKVVTAFTTQLQEKIRHWDPQLMVSDVCQKLVDEQPIFREYIIQLQRTLHTLKKAENEEDIQNNIPIYHRNCALPFSAALQLIPPWLATVVESMKLILSNTPSNHPDQKPLSTILSAFIDVLRNPAFFNPPTNEGESNEPKTPSQPRLVKHSLLIELCENKQRRLCAVFLFEDALVCTKPRISSVLPQTTNSTASSNAQTSSSSLTSSFSSASLTALPFLRGTQALISPSSPQNSQRSAKGVDLFSSAIFKNKNQATSNTVSTDTALPSTNSNMTPSYCIENFDVKWIIPVRYLVVYVPRHSETLEDKQKRLMEIQSYKDKIRDVKAEIKKCVEKMNATQGKEQFTLPWKTSLSKTKEKLQEQLMKLRAEMVKLPPNVFFCVGQDVKPQKLLLMSSEEEAAEWSTIIDQLQKNAYMKQGLVGGDISSDTPGHKRNISECENPNNPTISKTEIQRRLEMYKSALSLNNMGHYLLETEEESGRLTGLLETKIHSVENLSLVSDYFIIILVDYHGHLDKKAVTQVVKTTSSPTWDETFDLELDNSTRIQFCLYANLPGESQPKYINRLELELQEDAMQSYSKRQHGVLSTIKENSNNPVVLLFCVSLRFIPPKTLLARVPSMKKDSLFGVSLSKALKWDARHNIRQGNVPFLMRVCIEEIEKRGLSEDGLYRRCGPQEDRDRLKSIFEKHSSSVMERLSNFDVHSITGLLKAFLRELSDPLFTSHNYNIIVAITEMEDCEDRDLAIMQIARDLMEPNRSTLKYLLDHLMRIMQYTEITKMGSENLATMFASTAITPSSVDAMEFAKRSKTLVYFFTRLIQLYEEKHFF